MSGNRLLGLILIVACLGLVVFNMRYRPKNPRHDEEKDRLIILSSDPDVINAVSVLDKLKAVDDGEFVTCFKNVSSADFLLRMFPENRSSGKYNPFRDALPKFQTFAEDQNILTQQENELLSNYLSSRSDYSLDSHEIDDAWNNAPHTIRPDNPFFKQAKSCIEKYAH